MVLPDHMLRQIAEAGAITPYLPDLVQPASVDVRLGERFRVFNSHRHALLDLSQPVPDDLTSEVSWRDGFILHPGEFALGHTLERLDVPTDLVARIEGKSSVGRLGLIVHATAGYIDPGFRGSVTFEMTNLLRIPIRLLPGLPIAQISFQRMAGEPERPYQGRYQDDEAVAPSRYDGMADVRRAERALLESAWPIGTKVWIWKDRGLDGPVLRQGRICGYGMAPNSIQVELAETHVVRRPEELWLDEQSAREVGP